MPFEVSHRRTVHDSIAIDTDNDGKTLIEIVNGRGAEDRIRAEISLSDSETVELVCDLIRGLSGRRLAMIAKFIESVKRSDAEAARQEREANR